MHSANRNAAIITGHPPHGLRVFRFLELYRPVAYILTDGSGSTGVSKVDDAKRFLDKCGARGSSIFCPYTDAELYRIIREKDTDTLQALAHKIANDLQENDIDLVVGDAAEGYNPTHDLCRYLINAAVRVCERRRGKVIASFDFLLEGPPNVCLEETLEDAIWLQLGDDDLRRKMAAVAEYPEIAVDIEQALARYGEESFRTECLRPVNDPTNFRGWTTQKPHYETYGAQKVSHGVYPDLISFETHLLPLAQFLNSVSQ